MCQSRSGNEAISITTKCSEELFRFSEGQKFPGLWTFKNGVPCYGNWGSNFLWFISVSRKIIRSTRRPTMRQPRSRSSCLQERLLVWYKMNQQWFAEHASQLVLFDLVSLSLKSKNYQLPYIVKTTFISIPKVTVPTLYLNRREKLSDHCTKIWFIHSYTRR